MNVNTMFLGLEIMNVVNKAPFEGSNYSVNIIFASAVPLISPSCIATHTFVYSSQASEVHLIRAVENHNVLSKTATHIFHGLCLTW